MNSTHSGHRILQIERQCLRAEIAAITFRTRQKKRTRAAVLIAARLRRIDAITQTLMQNISPETPYP